MAQPQKKSEEPISWALIIFLFGIGIWPIGLVLLFVKLFGPDDQKKTAPPLRETEAPRTTSSRVQ